jgi:N-acetylglucosaminyldiphosphoundecaprenol N-acetyl-beta-D-mannosaminyltransferase
MHETKRRVIGLLGLPIDRVTLQEATDKVRYAARHQQRLFLSTPNLNFLMACQTDLDFRLSVIDSDLSTADGMPLIWMSRWLGAPLPERVTGSNIFERLRSDPLGPGEKPLRVYFFGGPDGAAKRAADNLNRMPQSLVCVGHASPGFGSVDDMSASHFIEHINASKADILVVAMGAVKGQAWLQKNRSNIEVPVISYLGAVINFTAGTVVRAPSWMQKIGFEWIWRVKEEPFLLKRYMRDAGLFSQIFFKKLLPHLLWMKINIFIREEKIIFTKEEDSMGNVICRMSGACLSMIPKDFYKTLSELIEKKEPMILDLTKMKNFGPEFSGDILNLYRLSRKEEMKFILIGGDLNNLLNWNGLNFINHDSLI